MENRPFLWNMDDILYKMTKISIHKSIDCFFLQNHNQNDKIRLRYADIHSRWKLLLEPMSPLWSVSCLFSSVCEKSPKIGFFSGPRSPLRG